MVDSGIRFVAGSRNNIRSSIWRLWAKDDDLYLAARSFAAAGKISFHNKSGIYRFAANSTTPRPAQITWRRGAQVAAGYTNIFAIIVPPPLANEPLPEKLPDNKPAFFIPSPPANKKLVFMIALTEKWYSKEDISEVIRDRTIKVISWINMKSEIAWLIYFYDNFSASEHRSVAEVLEKLKITLKPGGSLTTTCAHMFEWGGTGAPVPFLTDIQLGKENLIYG